MFSNRWAILGVLVVVRIAMGIQFQAVASITPVIAGDLHLDYAELGTLVGLYMLPGAFIAIPGGFLGSRFSDFAMVALGVATMVVGGVVAGFADGFTMLAAGRLISGAGAVIQSIFLVKMITEWFGEGEVITATAIMLTGWPTGIAIALATLGPIAEAWGWQAVMHLTAGGCAASLAVLWLGYRAPPGTAPPGRGVVGFRIPRRELGLICLGALVWSVYNVAYISYLSFGPALLIERGLDAAQAGIAVSLASWIALPAVPLGGYLADRIGRPVAMMTVCCLLAAATAAAIPQFDAPYALSAALGLFAAAPAGIIMAGVIGVMSPPFRAHGNAVLYTWFYAAMGLGPGFIGWAADLAGSVAAPMYLSAGVLVLSILLFIGFRSVAARSAD